MLCTKCSTDTVVCIALHLAAAGSWWHLFCSYHLFCNIAFRFTKSTMTPPGCVGPHMSTWLPQQHYTSHTQSIRCTSVCAMPQEEPQLVSREHSDPSMGLSRRTPAYSAATTPANSQYSTPNSTPKHAAGARPFEEGSSEQGHLRRQDSGKPSRFQRDAATGDQP